MTKKTEWVQGLRVAIINNDIAFIENLILNKNDLNCKNELGWTPLMFAIWEGKNKIAKMLIDYGVNLDIQDTGGDNALSLAVDLANIELVKLLTHKKANKHLANHWDRTPLMQSIVLGHKEITEFFLNNNDISLNLRDHDGYTALELANQYGKADSIKTIGN